MLVPYIYDLMAVPVNIVLAEDFSPGGYSPRALVAVFVWALVMYTSTLWAPLWVWGMFYVFRQSVGSSSPVPYFLGASAAIIAPVALLNKSGGTNRDTDCVRWLTRQVIVVLLLCMAVSPFEISALDMLRCACFVGLAAVVMLPPIMDCWPPD